ncbi:porin [Castellaniella hirudinis]|uniref:Porin n=1 Tax=Castellaniella hirudinis TaxID=1144617 RepID=A0ABV8RZ54_9BURK
MKKTLLAAALCVGFAGVAQAETSVTLYGILDTGYGYSQVKYDRNNVQGSNTSSGLRDGIFNGSRWGLKGSEDLGDGLRAVFQLEANANLGEGSGSKHSGFARQTFVGLTSDSWGGLHDGPPVQPGL